MVAERHSKVSLFPLQPPTADGEYDVDRHGWVMMLENSILFRYGTDLLPPALKQEKRGEGEERIETIGPIRPGFWAWILIYVKIAAKRMRFNYLQRIEVVPIFHYPLTLSM